MRQHSPEGAGQTSPGRRRAGRRRVVAHAAVVIREDDSEGDLHVVDFVGVRTEGHSHRGLAEDLHLQGGACAALRSARHMTAAAALASSSQHACMCRSTCSSCTASGATATPSGSGLAQLPRLLLPAACLCRVSGPARKAHMGCSVPCELARAQQLSWPGHSHACFASLARALT